MGCYLFLHDLLIVIRDAISQLKKCLSLPPFTIALNKGMNTLPTRCWFETIENVLKAKDANCLLKNLLFYDLCNLSHIVQAHISRFLQKIIISVRK